MPEGKQELVAVRVTQSIGTDGQQKQRRQMLIALGILFWLCCAPVVKRLALLVSAAGAPLRLLPNNWNGVSWTQSQAATRQNLIKLPVAKSKAPVPAAAPATSAPAIVATDRAVLPPLEVEVVAGGHHHAVQSGK